MLFLLKVFTQIRFTLCFFQTQKPDYLISNTSLSKILQKVLVPLVPLPLDSRWLDEGLQYIRGYSLFILKQNCQNISSLDEKCLVFSSAIVLENCMFILNKICFCSLQLQELFFSSPPLFDH